MFLLFQVQSVVVTLNERLCDLENQINGNKRSDSTPSSPYEKNNSSYEKRSTRSHDSIKRYASETKQSELENGPLKQKRKRV